VSATAATGAIIDCHCHAGTGDGLTGPWDTGAPLRYYLHQAEAAGIYRTVLFSVFHSDYTVANRQVARIVASRPDRFWGFAFVHPRRDAGRVARMVRLAVIGWGFRGIKVHRHDAHITREICEAAAAYRVPVLYYVMGAVAHVELLARAYPHVDFIIPHLGSFADDWRAQVALIDHLVRLPNVYTDTSGVRRFDILAEAVERAGARKFLFGSDGPWLHPGVELEKVRLLGLVAAEERMVLGGNLIRLTARAGKLSGARARRDSFQRFASRIDPAWHGSARAASDGREVPMHDPWEGEAFIP
jgi:predicted TIM-barrel fold metal-dependent hydrolase